MSHDSGMRMIQVPPAELEPLDRLKSGDPIVIRYTQSVAIGVNKAGQ